jgi:hypothetical protein
MIERAATSLDASTGPYRLGSQRVELVTRHTSPQGYTRETNAMTRLLGCLLLLVPLTVQAQEDQPAANPSRAVALEVTIFEISGNLQVQDPQNINVEKLQQAVNSAAEADILQHLTRIRLSTLDQLPAHVQLGETTPLASSRSFAPGRAGSDPRVAVSYRQERTGTVLEVTPRIADTGAVLVNIRLEQSRLAAPTDEDDDEGPPPMATVELKTTVTIPSGRTILVSGAQVVQEEADPRQTYIMVGATVLD